MLAVAGQVGFIFLIDNSSSNLSRSLLDELIEDYTPTKFHAIFGSANVGLGAAYNKGFCFARKHRAKFVLLLDQDSEIEQGMVSKLRSAHEQLTRDNVKIAAVGPRFVDPNSGAISQFVRLGLFRFDRLDCENEKLVAADFLVSSGSLLELSAIEIIGEMDEGLFIDHVDTEWCFRAKSKGFHVYGVCNALMRHSLGERRTRIWLLRWRIAPFHSPFRYYYIIRNSMLLYRRNYMPIKWKLADFARCIIFFLFFGLYDKNRRKNLKMMLLGFCDGYKKINGPLKH